MTLQETISSERARLLTGLAEASTTAELEQLRVSMLGKKSTLAGLLKGLGSLPADERAETGKALNELRVQIETDLSEYAEKVQNAELEQRIQSEVLDISLPGRPPYLGSQHLINRLVEEISEVFRGIGYSVVDGREIETDYYNFTALNTPPDHPSRGLQDTFYIVDRSGDKSLVQGESDVVLRTQTSGVQVHTMESQKPPIYMLAPGRVFRRDVADPSHLPQFTQIEGLVVDKGISFGDLKGTLEYFCQQIFGSDRKTRFRPHYFPFTEPSAEVDVSCGICHGAGCRFCKHTGWLEILGSGMVDPNVFGFVDIDPEEYSGFAFGMGVERIAALKYNIPDLRMLLEGDVRFLRQY